MNGDGTADLYVGQYSASGGGRAYVYSGVDGSTLHEFRGSAGDGGAGCGRGAGDVNGDGCADLAVGHYTSGAGATGAGRVVVYSGCDGTVLRKITSLTAGEQLGFDVVGVGDTNGDGYPELLCAAGGGGRAYLIAGVDVCVGDIDGDGTTGFGDFAALASGWGTNRADWNGDATTDFEDFAVLTSGWGCQAE